METRTVTVDLPSDLADKLDGLAKRLRCPKGQIVEKAIASYIALEETRHLLTLEALVDVDAGRTLDQVKVKRWMEGLSKAKRQQRR